MKYDVIIIGAGAAGLLAMKDLAKAGYHVCMLEAAENAGGRIWFTTSTGAGTSFYVKLPLADGFRSPDYN